MNFQTRFLPWRCPYHLYVRALAGAAICYSFVSPLPSYADSTCQVDVYYEWRPDPPVVEDDKKGKAAKREPLSSRKVFWTLLSQAGKTTDEVKATLERFILLEESKAQKECNLLHSSLASCMSSKLKAHGGMLRSLDFSSRRLIEEAITEECRTQKGECIGANHSSVVCVEIKKEEPKPEEAEGATDKKGGDKKGGKGDKKK